MRFFCKSIMTPALDADIVGCSVKGPYKKENQDYFGISSTDNRTVIAVCDGLGSASKSADGSKAMVESVLEILSEPIDTDTPIRIRDSWKSRVGPNPYEYDSTCKFVSVDGENTYFGGIGDGWISISTRDGFCELSSNGLFSNQTDSIMSPDIINGFTVKSVKTEDVRCILISTDGFSEDLDKELGKQLLEESYNKMESDPEGFLCELSNLMSNWPVSTNPDDKTAIFIRRSDDE